MDITIVIHGYPLQTNQEYYNEAEDIVFERVDQAVQIADQFNHTDNSIEMIFTGAEEAKPMYDHYMNNTPVKNPFSSVEVVFEEESETTFENVVNALELSSSNIIIPVSNSDHISRCMLYWLNESDSETMILGNGTQSTYTDTETDPLILEPAQLAPVIETLQDGLFDIEPSEYDEFSAELDRLLQKYS